MGLKTNVLCANKLKSLTHPTLCSVFFFVSRPPVGQGISGHRWPRRRIVSIGGEAAQRKVTLDDGETGKNERQLVDDRFAELRIRSDCVVDVEMALVKCTDRGIWTRMIVEQIV